MCCLLNPKEQDLGLGQDKPTSQIFQLLLDISRRIISKAVEVSRLDIIVDKRIKGKIRLRLDTMLGLGIYHPAARELVVLQLGTMPDLKLKEQEAWR